MTLSQTAFGLGLRLVVLLLPIVELWNLELRPDKVDIVGELIHEGPPEASLEKSSDELAVVATAYVHFVLVVQQGLDEQAIAEVDLPEKVAVLTDLICVVNCSTLADGSGVHAEHEVVLLVGLTPLEDVVVVVGRMVVEGRSQHSFILCQVTEQILDCCVLHGRSELA